MFDTPEIISILLPRLLYIIPNIFLLIAAIYFSKTTKLSGGTAIIIGVAMLLALSILSSITMVMYAVQMDSMNMQMMAVASLILQIIAILGTVLIGVGLISSAKAFKRNGFGGSY